MDLYQLKQTSRVKHLILEKYLPSWEIILGSSNRKLCYFDCFAGPGKYKLEEKIVDGSPLIAIEAAQKFLQRNPSRKIILTFVEEDQDQLDLLERELENLKPYKDGLQVFTINEDAPQFVSKILEQAPNLAPSFFFIDPYGHPLSIPIINEILSRRRTEALINFMHYQINRDVSNPLVEERINRMFGDEDWKSQNFLNLSGHKREESLLDYFLSRIKAKYKIKFRILFSPEDRGRSRGTKYYLVHVSNYPKAALLMKEVMWTLGDQDGIFEYGAVDIRPLFPRTPQEEDLKEYLIENFKGQECEFDDLMIKTLDLPFIERQYREVIKKMKKEELVEVTPITSKSDKGLRGKDKVKFL